MWERWIEHWSEGQEIFAFIGNSINKSTRRVESCELSTASLRTMKSIQFFKRVQSRESGWTRLDSRLDDWSLVLRLYQYRCGQRRSAAPKWSPTTVIHWAEHNVRAGVMGRRQVPRVSARAGAPLYVGPLELPTRARRCSTPLPPIPKSYANRSKPPATRNSQSLAIRIGSTLLYSTVLS